MKLLLGIMGGIMVNSELLNFDSTEDFVQHFLDSLLDSNWTYDYFVNWDKVFDNLKNSLVEIGILNSLNKVPPEELESNFRNILRKYPDVVEILPSILAIRWANKSKIIPIFDFDYQNSLKINFYKNEFDIDEIVNFSIKTGLLNLFNKIDDLYSYLVGTEVGLDSNGRKNRSGHIFEDIIGNLLENNFANINNIEVKKEDATVSIDRDKRFDYVIYKDNIPEYAIECNFYNAGGSKPIEVAHAYVELQKELDDKNIKFVWVTDGQGWRKMSKKFNAVIDDIDFLVNYNMLNEHFNDIFNFD